MGVINQAGLPADVPAGVPLIGYNNLVTSSSISSSTAAAGFPITNVANPATHLIWRGGVNTGDELVTVSVGLGNQIDYIAIAKHNFGSGAVFVSVEATDPSHILLHFIGADASTVINDSHSLGSSHTWTATGNAQIDTAIWKFDGSSLLLDGTGDYVSTPDHADFTLSDTDFTIDCWFNCVAASGSFITLAGQVDVGGGPNANTAWQLARDAANFMYAGLTHGTTFVRVNGTTQFTNALNTGWHHIAFVRTGDILKLFIDGVQEGGNVAFAGNVNDSTAAVGVGSHGDWITNNWNGSIDEFRLVVGAAMWTSNFTVPSRPYGVFRLMTASNDPTNILLHFDGADGATSTVDNNTVGSDRTWTFAGNAQIDTAITKFGSGALLLDGTGDWITAGNSLYFPFNYDDWTIDCWFNRAGGDGTFRRLCGQGNGSLNRKFVIGLDSANKISANVFQNGNPVSVLSTSTFVATGWHHMAFVRTGNVLKLFIDGVQEGGNVSFTGAVDQSSETVGIGVEGSAGTQSWNGSIDEFRLSIGTARWTTNFTPPTEASSAGSSITNDDPIIFRWQQQPLTNVILRLRPDMEPPEAAVIYAGKLLVLERSITIGHDHVPITYGRRTSVVNGMSETGNFLGRIVLGEYRQSKAQFEWFTDTFYRLNIDAFIEFAQEFPFFWAWSPSEYPAEVGYVWLTNNAEPNVDPVTRRIALDLEMRGIA